MAAERQADPASRQTLTVSAGFFGASIFFEMNSQSNEERVVA
jgi:hypothetical protein